MAVVSSIQFTDITNEYNDGANCLKNYLRYAEAVCIGNGEVTQPPESQTANSRRLAVDASQAGKYPGGN